MNSSHAQETTSLVSYRVLWMIVGVTAIGLATLVNRLAGGKDQITSMSASYWTDSGGIFIGCLVGIGFCMFIYNGFGPFENVFSKIAGFLAIVVALFPTNGKHAPPEWTTYVTQLLSPDLEVSDVHMRAAGIFFILLLMLMLIFRHRARSEQTEEPTWPYSIALLVMGTGLGILIWGYLDPETIKAIIEHVMRFIGLPSENYNPTFIGEQVFLWGFGVGWLLAGANPTLQVGFRYVLKKVSSGGEVSESQR